MDELRIYRLSPIGLDSNPRWQDSTCQGTVLVRARSPADARVVASWAEADFRDVGAKPAHGVSTRFASPFRDEQMYAVEEMTGARDAGPRGIVAGNIRPDGIRPLQSEPTEQPEPAREQNTDPHRKTTDE